MFAIKKIEKSTGKEKIFDGRYNTVDAAQEILVRFWNLRKHYNVLDGLTVESNYAKVLVVPVKKSLHLYL